MNGLHAISPIFIKIIVITHETGNLYVIKSDNEIHGVFAFILGEDVTYRVIEQGEWLSDAEYGTIHRVAGDGTPRIAFERL